MPSECRERRVTYAADLQVEFACTVDDQEFSVHRVVGSLPIMVKSQRCHLHRLDAKQLVAAHEEAEVWDLDAIGPS